MGGYQRKMTAPIYSRSLTLRQRLKASAKWILLLIVTVYLGRPEGSLYPPTVTHSILCCSPALLVLYRWSFGKFSELSEAFRYASTPDFLSVLWGEGAVDFAAELKFTVLLFLFGYFVYRIHLWYWECFYALLD